jgi:hypothetical protein
MGIGVPEGIHHWGIGTAHGVVIVSFAKSPTIQNGQHDRSYRALMFKLGPRFGYYAHRSRPVNPCMADGRLFGRRN